MSPSYRKEREKKRSQIQKSKDEDQNKEKTEKVKTDVGEFLRHAYLQAIILIHFFKDQAGFEFQLHFSLYQFLVVQHVIHQSGQVVGTSL